MTSFQDVIRKRIEANGEPMDVAFFTIEEFDALFLEYQAADMELDRLGVPSHTKEITADGEEQVALPMSERLKVMEKPNEVHAEENKDKSDFQPQYKGVMEPSSGENLERDYKSRKSYLSHWPNQA